MRNYRMDNLKAFLIYCVILGHLLELFTAGKTLYRIIYTFHMPAFVFVSGYFSVFDKKRILENLVYPYFLFQTLYYLFDALVLKQDLASMTSLQYTTPYWLLWYLLAMIFYNLLLPMMDGVNSKALLVIACVLSLLAGLDSTVGYYISLSRFFTFLPYFSMGVVLRRVDIEPLLHSTLIRIGTIMMAVMVCVWCKLNPPMEAALYGSCSYATEGSSLAMRFMLMIVGFNWIFLFLCWFPKKKLPFLSTIGRYTLVPFLLHGFLKVFWAYQGGPFIYSGMVNVILASLLSLGLTVIFGNQYVGGALQMIFTGQGIELLWRKLHRKKNGGASFAECQNSEERNDDLK